MYNEEDFLQLSGIQHFAFCRRQWALIHIENQWAENYRTVDGSLMHEKAHDRDAVESRGDLLIMRAVAVRSARLGVSGECDVVEFRRRKNGALISGRDGLWQPYPVEYKRGSPKEPDADTLQLCCQAMCLEEMLCCEVGEGAIFYGETRRRLPVSFTDDLRDRVKTMLQEMHDLFARGYTPKVKPSKSCNACSLKELCLPSLMRKSGAAQYIAASLEELV